MDLNKKILVVEDDAELRKIIIDQLIDEYVITSAEDGEDAIAQIAANRPDAIVLDLLLPKLDGFGVLEKLRAMPEQELAHIPVVVVSNLSDQASMDKANQYHIEEYFVKSDINFGTLSNRIKRLFTIGPSVTW